MSIEDGSEEVTNYQEIVDDIEKNGYYSLPAGSIVDIKLVTGIPIEIPILDINNNPLKDTVKHYNNINVKQLNQVELKQQLMLGGVTYHHLQTGETELTITSPKLIELQKKKDEWLENLAKEYKISDDYIDSEHEEIYTGSIDISLYVQDHPEVADEILQKEKYLTEEITRLQHEIEIEFIKNLGMPIPEDNTLIGVSVLMKTK